MTLETDTAAAGLRNCNKLQSSHIFYCTMRKIFNINDLSNNLKLSAIENIF